MTVGILSDTHGCWDERFATHLGDCGLILHAGDVGDISIIYRLEELGAKVLAVRGNCDSGDVRRRCPESITEQIEGVHLFMTHIGGYPGKYSPGIKDYLREIRANLFISGHSHILKIMPDPALGLLHVNPGAAGTQGWQRERTLVKLDISQGIISNVRVIQLGKLTM